MQPTKKIHKTVLESYYEKQAYYEKLNSDAQERGRMMHSEPKEALPPKKFKKGKEKFKRNQHHY
jgi:hypothetical protein